MTARSADGLSFTRTNQIVTDQGDVPDLVVDSDGVVYLYYVGATVGREINKIAVAISRDGGETWKFHKAVLEGFEGMTEPVDPDVVILPDGTFRLFVTCSVRGDRLKTYYADGRDGIRFTKRGVAFEPPGEPLDPNVFFAGGVWHIYAGGQTSRPGANWHGTSASGTYFTFDREEMFVKDGRPHAVSNTIPVEGGYRMYAFPHAVQPVIHSFFSPDGVNWRPEEGVRLAMDPASGLESEGVKDAAVVRLPGGGYLMVYVTVIDEPRTASAWDLDFRPDRGIRITEAQLPKPWVAESGEVYLYFEDISTGRPRELRAVSSDGLVFSSGQPPPDQYGDPRRLRLPDGTWRLYLYDPRARELRSSSSRDGLSFAPDPGARYVPQPEDRGSMGVYDHFTDSQGGVVLLYVGDMQGVNNLRRAYSPPGDNGWTFQFDRGNILEDAGAGGGPNSFVDPKSIRLPDGRIRLFVMRQGTIYSFLSEDEGRTWRREEGARLSPADFGDLNVRSLHDPWVVRLPDGRYRMYAAAAMGGPDGPPRFAIVSATTPAPPVPVTLKKAFVMALHACDPDEAECRDPRNHKVYLAESDDGVKWSAVEGWRPYPGSVPGLARRGNSLYIYSAGSNPLVRLRLDTGMTEGPLTVSLPGLEAGFVDPSPVVDEQGRLTLFFLPGRKGSDPAGCPPDQPTCTQRFLSATESPGSDGSRFEVDPGERAVVRLGGPGEPRSASDPDVFFDGNRWVLYLSHGAATSVWTASTLRGAFTKVGDLTAAGGGVPCGYFDASSQRYWTFAHTTRSGVSVIRRAVHPSLTAPLAESDWQTVLTGPDLGLSAKASVESPDVVALRGAQ